MALGESVLLIGDTFAGTQTLNNLSTLAFLVAFAGALAMWWLYFDTGSEDGSHAIAHSGDPGRMGACFHYVHVLIVGGIIVAAVGNELVIAHPHGHLDLPGIIVMLCAPIAYLAGNAIYRRIVYGSFPASHVAGVLVVAALLAVVADVDLLAMNGLTTLVMLGAAAWGTLRARSGTVGRSTSRARKT